MSDPVKEAAVGKWPGIFNALGIEVGDGRHTSCPMCGGKDRFRFDDKDGSGTWFCNNCGAGDGWTLVMKKCELSFPDALNEVGQIVGTITPSKLKKESNVTPEIFLKMFNNSKPVRKDDPVERYLKSRGLSKIPNLIRYHPRCWESETASNQKAMLTIFHNRHGKAITIHRTYLDADGNKLNIQNVKKIMPPLTKMTGGAARLYPLEGGFLGIAEGVETAIAAHEDTKIPIWATLSATLMESFEVPDNVTQLFVFADNDRNYTGQKAAYNLANRVAGKGIPVTVYLPDIPGEDWADVYARMNKEYKEAANEQTQK
jgi:putative DNA primase/helicase